MFKHEIILVLLCVLPAPFKTLASTDDTNLGLDYQILSRHHAKRHSIMYLLVFYRGTL